MNALNQSFRVGCLLVFLLTALHAHAFIVGAKKTCPGTIRYTDGREVAYEAITLPKGGAEKIKVVRVVDGKEQKETIDALKIDYIECWYAKDKEKTITRIYCVKNHTVKGKVYPWWCLEYALGPNMQFYVACGQYRMSPNGLLMVYKESAYNTYPDICYVKSSDPKTLHKLGKKHLIETWSNKTRKYLQENVIADDEALCKQVEEEKWKGRVQELFQHIALSYQPGIALP